MSLNNIDPKLSVFIPFVFPNITEDRIVKVFNQLQLGAVERVDFVDKLNPDGKSYKMAFIHMLSWHMNASVASIHEKLTSGNSARIVYDDPWFWNMYVNKKPRSVEELNLEKELAITKEVLESERAKITLLESHLGTYQFNFPAVCQQVWDCVPYRLVPKKGAKLIEGYGHPYECVSVPTVVASGAVNSINQHNQEQVDTPLHLAPSHYADETVRLCDAEDGEVSVTG